MVRALVPKKDVAVSSPTASSSDTKTAKRRCISSACFPCRKRKSKCDGGTPVCATCTAVYKTECHYDNDSEQRRNKPAAQKRHVAELQDDDASTSTTTAAAASLPSAADVLLDTLRSMPEHEVPGFVHQIRIEEDLDALADSLREQAWIRTYPSQTSGPQEGDLSAIMSKPTFLNSGVSRVFGSTSGMGQVVEPDSDTGYRPPVTIASYESWTSVTKDREFVQRLLRLYFDVTQPFFSFLAQKPFWDSFHSGSTKYCSPLLVNACCAIACHSSDEPAARTDPADFRTAGDHFFAEAKRLVNEFETPCLTTVQAFSVLGLREPAAGRDSSGYMYAGRGVRMALEMGLHLQFPGAGNDPVEDEVRKVTFWSCFAFDTMWTLCVGRISQLPRAAVTVQKPTPEELLTPGSTSSTSTQPGQSSHVATTDSNESRHILYHLSSLSELANDNVSMFYAPRERFTSNRLLNFYSRYRAWHRSLPRIWQVADFDETDPPSRCVLELLMWYNSCVLMLFRPLIKVDLTNSDVSPRDVCLRSANEITRLTTLYRRVYGLRRVNTLMSHINMSSSMIHLVHSGVDESRKYLVQDMQHLEEMSVCAYFAVRAFRTIESLAKQWDIKLPSEILEKSTLFRPGGALFSPGSSHLMPIPQSTTPGQSYGSGAQSGQSPNYAKHTMQTQSNGHQQEHSPRTDGASMGYPPHYSVNDLKLPLHTPTSSVSQIQQQAVLRPAPASHSRSVEPSAAENFFWTPFGEHTQPILAANNVHVSPMDLNAMLGNEDEWTRLARDGFSIPTEWSNGMVHGVSGVSMGNAPGIAGSHTQRHGGEPRHEEQHRSGEPWGNYGTW